MATLTIELATPKAAQLVLQAVDFYKEQLKSSIERTQRRLSKYEQEYKVTTEYFLSHMTAEDLAGGDLAYVEWAGEAKLLAGLRAELEELERASYQFS